MPPKTRVTRIAFFMQSAPDMRELLKLEGFEGMNDIWKVLKVYSKKHSAEDKQERNPLCRITALKELDKRE